MQWFRNMNIRGKLLLGFLCVSVIAGVIGIVGVSRLTTINASYVSMNKHYSASMPYLIQIAEYYQRMRVNMRDAIASDSREKRSEFVNAAKDCDRKRDEAAEKFKALVINGEIQRIYEEYLTASREYTPVQDEIFSLALDGKKQEATAAVGRGKGVAARMQDALDKISDVSASEMEKVSVENSKTARAAASLMVACMLLGVLISAMLGFLISNMIGKPMRELAEKAKLVALGDVTVRAEASGKDELAELTRAFAAVIENIKGQADSARRIAEGDLDIRIQQKSESDVLAKSMAQVVATMRALVEEIGTIGRAGKEGRLSVRGDAAKFSGGFRDVIVGLNETLDAVIEPVQEAASVLEQVAARDLSARVMGEYQGDHARIKDSLNKAVDNLDTGLQQVAVAVEQVASAASQIGVGSQSLAQGASEQASSLEEIQSGLQEMSSMTRQNAGFADSAKNLSTEASGSANKGLESMNRLSEAMERIKGSSDSTAKIVKTIDEIAFQTNLLALNAAVEAARAGDAGKGFAVVAEEVRNLAMRSAEAAKNTANLIEESVRNAVNGVELNSEVLQELHEIASQAAKVGGVMQEIGQGSEQQASGIDQITSAVEQMNQVTQQNAANSEESASAAEELAGQAGELRSMVSRFQLSSMTETRFTNPHPEARRAPVAGSRQQVANSAGGPSRRPKLEVVGGKGGRESGTSGAARPFHDDGDAAIMRSF